MTSEANGLYPIEEDKQNSRSLARRPSLGDMNAPLLPPSRRLSFASVQGDLSPPPPRKKHAPKHRESIRTKVVRPNREESVRSLLSQVTDLSPPRPSAKKYAQASKDSTTIPPGLVTVPEISKDAPEVPQERFPRFFDTQTSNGHGMSATTTMPPPWYPPPPYAFPPLYPQNMYMMNPPLPDNATHHPNMYGSQLSPQPFLTQIPGIPAPSPAEEDPSSPAVRTMLKNIQSKPVVLFTEASSEVAGRCRVVLKILSNLGVDADNEMVVYTLDARNDGPELARQLLRMTGYERVPVLFVGSKCFGDYQAILSQCRTDQLRPRLMDAGVRSVVSAIPTATLEDNIFGYPKALATGQQRRFGEMSTMNVLIACCGSSASDKIPELVERCVKQHSWAVKLICTKSGEHFFKSFGMQRVINAIGSENIYRDEDEWSFEYEKFDMPVRACHLAIRKWADILVVAPVTCNTMAKAAAGIGDNLLSSVLVAWEYHKKPAIFCPACNVDMWNNFPTQRNVKTLKQMGVDILGPRIDRLTNGQIAIGCMERLDVILERLKKEESITLNGNDFFFSRAKLAAMEDNFDLWHLVLRGVEEGVMDPNAQMEENGNTLLHFAAGGESFADQGGVKWGKPDLYPLGKLVELGADPNIPNNYQFTPLHVAISAGDVSAVRILLDAGADATGTLIDFPIVNQGIRELLETKEDAFKLVTPYYYTYGSLKRGFPNYENHSDHLQNFIGTATTVEKYPLVVPHLPSCQNPNCPYLHQQATLCNIPGKGLQVVGEVFEVTAQDIQAFDKLEGFGGGNILDNVYTRALVDVDVEGIGVLKAYVYFTSDGDGAIQLVELDQGKFIEEYLITMARGELKPNFVSPEKKLARRTSIRRMLSSSDLSIASSRSAIPGQSQRLSALPETSTKSKDLEHNHSHGHDTGHSHSHDHYEEHSEDESSLNMTNLVPATVRGDDLRASTHIDNLVHENFGTIQQAINTCNLAAITMALKILGVNCPMDDIFSSLRLPTSWVVEHGLTLAQVYIVLLKLCGSHDPAEALAPGLDVECFHFDQDFVDYDSFTKYLKESIGDEDDVLIGNFSTKIARDLPNGGGHFSLIAGYDEPTETVTIADVHPKKYGARWTCSAKKLCEAMMDKDSSVRRSRGMIRVAYKNSTRIQCMKTCRRAVSFYDSRFNDEMISWLSRWGDLPVDSFESHLNMGGMNALGLLLSGFLSQEDYDSLSLPGHVSADYLAWNLRLSVIQLLSELVSPRTLASYARRACDKLQLNLQIRAELADTHSPDTLWSWLNDCVGPSHSAAALALLDLNVAYGTNLMNTIVGSESAVLDHGAQHWCCIVATADDEEVIIADPRAKMMTRLWRCSAKRLRDALLRAEKDPGRMVVIGNVSLA